MDLLPGELDQQVALHTPFAELLALCTMGSKYRAICDDAVFWRKYYYKHYSSQEPMERNFKQACHKAEAFRASHDITNTLSTLHAYVHTKYDLMLRAELQKVPDYTLTCKQMYEIFTHMAVTDLRRFIPTSPCSLPIFERLSLSSLVIGTEDMLFPLLRVSINLQQPQIFEAILAAVVTVDNYGEDEDTEREKMLFRIKYNLVTDNVTAEELELLMDNRDNEVEERTILNRICMVGAYKALAMYLQRWPVTTDLHKYEMLREGIYAGLDFVNYIEPVLATTSVEALDASRNDGLPLIFASPPVLEYLYDSRYRRMFGRVTININDTLFDSASEPEVYRRLVYILARTSLAPVSRYRLLQKFAPYDKFPLFAYLITNVTGMKEVVIPSGVHVSFKYPRMQALWDKYLRYLQLLPDGYEGPGQLDSSVTDIATEALGNTYYRQVLHTTLDQQIVLMAGDVIHLPDSASSRIVTVVQGEGEVNLNLNTMLTRPVYLGENMLLSPGAMLDIIGKDIKLYVIYSPPVFKINLTE